MSGGSLDYLCVVDGEGRFGRSADLDACADLLGSIGEHDAERRFREFVALIERFNMVVDVRWEELAGLMKAVEWHLSSDWGEGQVREAVEDWRRGPDG